MHVNKINNKIYIGIAKDINHRWGTNGQGYLKKEYNEYNQPVFAAAIKKYGWDNFEHIIFMENLYQEDACHVEQMLIALYKTNCCRYKNPEFGYNMTDGGEGSFGFKHSDDVKEKMRNNHPDVSGDKNPRYGQPVADETKEKMKQTKAYAIVQLNLDGSFVKEHDSISDAANEMGVNRNNILRACTKTQASRMSCGYLWMSKEEYEQCGSVVYRDPYKKQVVQLDINNNLIAMYDSIKDAAKATNISSANICTHCKKHDVARNGAVWLYKEDWECLTAQNE